MTPSPKLILVLLLSIAGCTDSNDSAANPSVIGTMAGTGGASGGQGGASGGQGGTAGSAGAAGSTGTGGTAGSAGSGAGSGGDDAGVLEPDGGEHSALTPEQLQRQSCDPERPAIAYRASTGDHSEPVEAVQSAYAPVPCVHYTDHGSAEPSLGITSDGTVFVAPVFDATEGSGIIHSSDDGESWDIVRPKLPNGGAHGRVQPYMHIDPKTDRIFFATMAGAGIDSPTGSGLDMSFSADKGTTWSFANLIPDAADWIKIFTGPPVTSTTSGYPNVVYASAPTPISTPIPVAELIGLKPINQPVYKSLDGGTTWSHVADRSLLPEDVEGCDPFEWIIYGNALVASDGTLYQVLRQCTSIKITASRDEGATWTMHAIPEGTLPPFDTRNLLQIVANPNILVTELLTSDSDDNLYLAWVDADGRLRLTSSRDGAMTWSAPVTVSAPDIRQVRYAALASSSPGTLALAYYGSTDDIAYHGYITETLNAFDATPSFVSVTVNDPTEPLYKDGFEVGYLGILNGYDLNEIVHVKYAPNGDIWASFTKDMCKGVQTETCEWNAEAHASSAGQAVVGRMVHGVHLGFAAATPFVPEESCSATSMPEIDACYDTAEAEAICTELTTCVCDHCACQLNRCEGYPDCAAVRKCATANNCRGLDCIFACGEVSYKAGELMSSMALSVADCMTTNSCPTACPLF